MLRLVPTLKIPAALASAIGSALLLCPASAACLPQSSIPQTWDEKAIATLELPSVLTGKPVEHVGPEFYRSVAPTTVYRTYPVYVPDRAPEGYFASLLKADPEVLFDSDEGNERDHWTNEEWIRSGRAVFDWPVEFRPVGPEFEAQIAGMLATVHVDVTSDGRIPYWSYVVREKGVVELGSRACSTCHVRVQRDGTEIIGAQGTPPFDAVFAMEIASTPTGMAPATAAGLFGTPRVEGIERTYPADLSTEELVAALMAIPRGVLARHGTSPFSPVQIPDLIGIKDRKYLDRTGLVRHRGIGDLMRYVALNQDMDSLGNWDGFVPAVAFVDELPEAPPEGAKGPPPTREEALARASDPKRRFRYSELQLFALSKWLYALKPPENPNIADELAQRGRRIFEEEECGRCHTPPLYTSNQLMPTSGFRVPDDLRASDDIHSRSIDTDPRLTLTTRRGTGFYKVPSLLGVWYRGPFHHDGSIATLEDWFDPKRVQDDYVPTGWNPGGGARPVRGHRYGLGLDPDEREALIAFLRTL